MQIVFGKRKFLEKCFTKSLKILRDNSVHTRT